MTCGSNATERYTNAWFKSDFDSRMGEFQVQFTATNIIHNFNWREVVESPTIFVFFGPPLSASRSYDKIFKSVENIYSLYVQGPWCP